MSERVLKLKPDFDLDGFLKDTRLNTPRPPKDPTGRPLSFVKQQEERGAVKRGLRPVDLEESIELADQHVAPEALKTELGDLKVAKEASGVARRRRHTARSSNRRAPAARHYRQPQT